MGKCTRKPKTSGDVSTMDVSQSSLGVRTRAKNLSLQRLQSSSSADASPWQPKPDYLELRSRRLEKLPLHLRNSRNNPSSEQSFVRGDEETPRVESSPDKTSAGLGFSIGRYKDEDDCFDRRSGVLEIGDSEIEVSLGENNLDMDVRERTTRESTPISLLRTADSITMPGSSTPMVSLRNIPTAQEIEEFFILAEQPQQRHFVDTYNFDILNDMPLPGRYEWVRVTPCAE